jgi:hypothetical protein
LTNASINTATEPLTQYLIDKLLDTNTQTKESITHPFPSITAATGQLREATKQTSVPRKHQSADRTGITTQAKSPPILYRHDEHRQLESQIPHNPSQPQANHKKPKM